VDFVFEVQQNLRFEVIDTHSTELLGAVNTTVGAIVGAQSQSLALDLMTETGANAGQVLLRAEEVRGSTDMIYVELAAKDVEDVEFWGRSDPFIIIFKECDGTYVKVYTTEYLPNNLNPLWKGFQLSIQALCSGDYFKPIKIEICEV
jgi:hypothetical protein